MYKAFLFNQESHWECQSLFVSGGLNIAWPEILILLLLDTELVDLGWISGDITDLSRVNSLLVHLDICIVTAYIFHYTNQQE